MPIKKAAACRHCWKETAMDDKSIEVHVFLGHMMPEEPLILRGLPSSNTVTVVKDMVKNWVFKHEIQPNYRPLLPANKSMVSSNGHAFEDDQTLGSLSKYFGSDTITLHYIVHADMESSDMESSEEVFWLRLTRRARFIEEPHEPYMRGWEPQEVVNPVSRVKRPISVLAPLPFAELPDLGIHGRYELFNSKNIPMPSSDIEFAISVKTPASVILLAPNHEILDHLVSLNSKYEYLVLQISWDLLSYLFLRTLRTSYPDIPIVAVTDLDPHHLDLLTFLDTPPEEVLQCYGLEDFDGLYFSDITFVGIEWLGLRPDDCEGLHIDVAARSTPLQGFDEVIRMLRVNPFLRRKPDWLVALDWLDMFGKSVSFRSVDDFISRKLSKKDWV